MRKPTFLRCWFSLVCLLATLTCSDRSGASLTPQMRTEDSRLNVPVTLRAPRIRVSELLERLSQQSGVPLRLSERSPASGVTLMACLNRVPLASALNALATLPGCRGYRWLWARSGQPGQFTYSLLPPELSAIAAQWNNKSQEAFEKQSELLIKASRMSPEERKGL